MTKHYFIERLGGADRKLLADEETAGQSGERTRFAAMAGVLLTTASVATVSMFFALHHAVGVSVGWSVPLALAWGTVILNIDRFLVITMSGTRGHPLQMTGMVLFRLALAALIALVVSMPLVLQIFASDISAELPILQEQKSAQFAKNLTKGADGQQLATINSKIAAEQNAINGTGSQGDASAVQALTEQLGTAQQQVNAATLKYQCELQGGKGNGCPTSTSGQSGDGPRTQADQEAVSKAQQNYNIINGELTQAQAKQKADEKIAVQGAGNAQQALAKLVAQRQALLNQEDTQIANDDQANKKDTGLLAQIQALDAASAQNPGLAAAHWTVTALFFVIELLPVAVKSILLLGTETPYERIVAKRGDAAVVQAERKLVADMEVVEADARARLALAEAEARSRLEVRERQLLADSRIADGQAQVEENDAADRCQRDEENRREVNERVAQEWKKYVMAMLDDWGHTIRETMSLLTQRQSANGQTQPSQEKRTSGYSTPNGGNSI
jgi:hypothetical protein